MCVTETATADCAQTITPEVAYHAHSADCAQTITPEVAYHAHHRAVAIYRTDVRTPGGRVIFYSYEHPGSRMLVRNWTYKECVAEIDYYWKEKDDA